MNAALKSKRSNFVYSSSSIAEDDYCGKEGGDEDLDQGYGA
jgi:hypothetical protein